VSEELEDYLDASGKPGPDGSGGRASDVLTAVAMVGAELGELRAHLGDVLKDMNGVREDITGLRRAVDTLSALSQQVTELAVAVDELAQTDSDKAPKPVDLEHIADEDRDAVLQELANWVRTVLFGGWPWTQDRLRGCWSHHPDLINDLLMLKTAYETAYAAKSRRAHHAADFRHLLDYVMDVADERTRECPAKLAYHEVTLPARNDITAVNAAARDMVLARVWRLTEQANRARRLGRDDLAARAQDVATAAFDEHQISKAEYELYEQRVQRSRAAAEARRARQTRETKDD
jgi:hypothetical protein